MFLSQFQYCKFFFFFCIYYSLLKPQRVSSHPKILHQSCFRNPKQVRKNQKGGFIERKEASPNVHLIKGKNKTRKLVQIKMSTHFYSGLPFFLSLIPTLLSRVLINRAGFEGETFPTCPRGSFFFFPPQVFGWQKNILFHNRYATMLSASCFKFQIYTSVKRIMIWFNTDN